MKLWYLLMQFDGPYVCGMVALGNTPEDARKECIKLVNSNITKLRKLDTSYTLQNLKREISFRRTLNNPHRKTRGRAVLQIREISGAVYTGHWLSVSSEGNHICNIPTTWKEHPIGYIYSELKD